jgi:hypothetical protein
MTLLIAGLLIFAFMKRREEDEFGAEEINLLDKEEIETPITEISLEEPSKFIESWDGLPGGGEYHDRDDGMWYETSEGVWWWRHPDGRFERV